MNIICRCQAKLKYISISLPTQTPSICSLSHAHLLPVLGYSCDGPRLCLIYPYMANGSLDAHLKDHTHLTPGVRVQIACDVSSALAYLHCQAQQVVIHRDVKRYMYVNSNTLLVTNNVQTLPCIQQSTIKQHFYCT